MLSLSLFRKCLPFPSKTPPLKDIFNCYPPHFHRKKTKNRSLKLSALLSLPFCLICFDAHELEKFCTLEHLNIYATEVMFGINNDLLTSQDYNTLPA
jgi:hypothetical protein